MGRFARYVLLPGGGASCLVLMTAALVSCAPERTCAVATTVQIGDLVFRADPAFHVSEHDKRGRSRIPCPDAGGRQVGDNLSRRLDDADIGAGLSVLTIEENDEPDRPLEIASSMRAAGLDGGYQRFEDSLGVAFMQDAKDERPASVTHCPWQPFLDVEGRDKGFRCVIYIALGSRAQATVVFYAASLDAPTIDRSRQEALRLLEDMKPPAG